MDFINRMWNLRINRLRFALYYISTIIAAILFAYLSQKLKLHLIFIFILLFTIIVKVFLYKQRLNDIGKSGMLIFLTVIPIANVCLLLYLLFKAGTTMLPENNDGSTDQSHLNNV